MRGKKGETCVKTIKMKRKREKNEFLVPHKYKER